MSVGKEEPFEVQTFKKELCSSRRQSKGDESGRLKEEERSRCTWFGLVKFPVGNSGHKEVHTLPGKRTDPSVKPRHVPVKFINKNDNGNSIVRYYHH